MELPAPVLLLASYHTSHARDPESSHTAVFMLLALFTGHYVNRAVVSPLRTPSRSPSHIIVPICAIIFNTINASLMGTFFAFISNSAADLTRMGPPCALPRSAQFWMGIMMFILGLVSNIWHDEILLRLRKKPDSPSALSHSTSTLLKKEGRRTVIAPKYSIPYGGLYRFVS
jgi:3-oxo-5-alpha-steroid 4-dehydrogenase 1